MSEELNDRDEMISALKKNGIGFKNGKLYKMYEENKYYTPEKEEFHIGFIYEVNGAEVKTPNNSKGWEKVAFGANYNDFLMPTNPNYNIMSRNFRVKYIDKEDIENLGWKITNTREDEFDAQLEIDDYNFFYLTYDSFLHTLTVGLFSQTRLGKKTFPMTHDSITVFVGVIKNKSEFNKLIEQLKEAI